LVGSATAGVPLVYGRLWFSRSSARLLQLPSKNVQTPTLRVIPGADAVSLYSLHARVTGAQCGPSREPLRGELRSPLTGRRTGLVTAMCLMG
jgi:hypothetical protein